MWDEHTTRKPMLLLRLSGLFLLRLEARALSGLLFQEPPRNTRGSETGAPCWQASKETIVQNLRATPPLRGGVQGAVGRCSVASDTVISVNWGTNTPHESRSCCHGRRD